MEQSGNPDTGTEKGSTLDHGWEEELSIVTNAMQDAMITIGSDARITLFNPAAEKMFGRPKEEMLGQTLDRLMPERFRKNHHEYISSYFASGKPDGAIGKIVELPGLRSDGTLFPMAITLSPGKRGEEAFVVAVARDITERKDSDQALRDSHQKFVSVLNSLDSLVYVIDFHTHEILFINETTEKIFGQVVGMPCWQALQKGQSGPCDHCVQAKLLDEEGRPTGMRVTEMKNTANHRWYELRDQAIPWIDGRFVRLEIARDITDRREAEEKRRRFDTHLRHSQKMESLGILAGGIAHDFNNLLTGVLGHAELALLDLPGDSQIREQLEEIRKAGTRLSHLSNQMLAYSGKSKMVMGTVVLNLVIEEMKALLHSSVGKKATLTYVLDQDLASMEADVSQIQQLVMNLVTNAHEALGEETGEIRIRTFMVEATRELLDATPLGRKLATGTYVGLEVTDTGQGMDGRTMEKLFDPFFTTKFVGRGMGLSVVLGILRSHLGTIQVASAPGRGSTFTVLFPTMVEVMTWPLERREPVDRDWRGRGTILLIDDESMVLTVGERMVKKLGFHALTAGSGREGIECFREHAREIGAVLLDMTMQDMNGVEAFHELRKIDHEARVILCSGYTEEEVTRPFGDRDLAGFLQKPFEMDTLIQMLRSVFEDGST